MSILDYLSTLGRLSSPNQTVNNIHSLNFKYLGIYFTAEWCTSCKRSSPLLQNIVKKIQQKTPGLFKIITIRLGSQPSTLGNKFWRFSFLPQTQTSYLSDLFNINFLPNIVILNKNSVIISRRGFQDLMDHQQNVTQLWDKLNI